MQKDKSKCQCICKYSTYFIHIAKIWVEYSRYVAKACFAKDRIRRVDKIHFPVLYANLIYFYFLHDITTCTNIVFNLAPFSHHSHKLKYNSNSFANGIVNTKPRYKKFNFGSHDSKKQWKKNCCWCLTSKSDVLYRLTIFCHGCFR